MRTGPWKKYIVVTNCSYVRHQGKKTQADISICLNTFRGLTHDQWALMCQDSIEPVLLDIVQPTMSVDTLRNRRIAYYIEKH
jgi:hypothetical protein